MKKTVLLILVISFNLIKAQDITTVAGNGYCCNTMDSVLATTTSVYYPTDMAVDGGGNIFISEANRIRKVDPTGIITVYAGSYGGFSGDGGPALAAKLQSSAVAVDNAGNVYTADWFNHRIRKINASGIINTICGNGISSFSGDGGPAINATLNGPYGLAVDAAGNIYISDTDNNRVRKINTAGIITTVAGNGASGFSGDGGPATSASLNNPIGVAVDAAGNIYIADWQNDRIRKVNTSGIISTIAGTGTGAYSGDGGLATLAELNGPAAVDCDQYGNVFIADDVNRRIRMINSSGIISTLAGTGTYGSSGDGGPAISAEIMHAWGLCTDSYGNVYIADENDNRIRKIYNVTGINNLTANDKLINIFPNPSSDKFYIETNSTEEKNLQVLDLNGKLILQQTIFSKVEIDLSFVTEGVYILSIKSKESTTTKKLVVVK